MELLLLCTAVTWKVSPLILGSQGMQWIINCKPDKQCLAGVSPQPCIYIYTHVNIRVYVYIYIYILYIYIFEHLDNYI